MVNAILAAVASFLIPGLGQVLAGNIRKGLTFFVILLIIIAIGTFIFNSWVIYLVDIIYSVYVALDAFKMAKRRRN